MNLQKHTIEELVSMKNEIECYINDYEDGFTYICKVRSYGSNWTERVTNSHSLQELSWKYAGQDGIIDIYSTNPDLSHIDNYGDTMFIVSEFDYNKWDEYKTLKNHIAMVNDELTKWETKDDLPFYSRPMFAPYYTREELAELEKSLEGFDMSFSFPKPYDKSENHPF
jgi:hypothetical protein